MKLSHCVVLAALAASLASGCSRRPKNITPLPSSDRVGGVGTDITSTGGPLSGGNFGSDSGGRVVPNPGIPTGQPLNRGQNPNARDLTQDNVNPAPSTFTPLNPPVNPGDSAQADRSKWESWPQDAETLRGNTVFFDFDKSVVKSSERAKVAAIAEYLKGHPGYMLKVDGHADERGTEDYNRALGERRALSLREMLLNLGVPSDTVVTSTFGEDRPAELGHNEAAWAKNRRAEPVVLMPPGATR